MLCRINQEPSRKIRRSEAGFLLAATAPNSTYGLSFYYVVCTQSSGIAKETMERRQGCGSRFFVRTEIAPVNREKLKVSINVFVEFLYQPAKFAFVAIGYTMNDDNRLFHKLPHCRR